MEIRQLEIFRALAEELNFTRAAERAHCVQSNVSIQIRALEDELGTPLFDRLSKRVTLTDAGRRFRTYVETVLATIEEARQALQSNGDPAGTLHIGTSGSLLNYRLPEAFHTLHRRYPKVELSCRLFSDEGLFESLETGELDLAVCMVDAVAHQDLRSLRLRTEKLLFVADPADSLVAKKKMRPHDISGRTVIVTESGCIYRKRLDELLSSQNIPSTKIMEFSSIEAVIECVALGMGVALLPESEVAEALSKKQVRILPWDGPKMDVATHLIWHKDKWISPAFSAFISVMREISAHEVIPISATGTGT